MCVYGGMCTCISMSVYREICICVGVPSQPLYTGTEAPVPLGYFHPLNSPVLHGN
jgi:hypothetical protein